MSAPPSAPSASGSRPAADQSAATKKTTISTEEGRPSKTFFDAEKFIKAFRIMLTLFYGQFFANGLYDNLIRGIPVLNDKPSAFPIIKVVLGLTIIGLSVFAMVGIWLKNWRFIFASAIALIVVSLVALIITVIDLVMRYERKEIPGLDFSALIAIMVFETLFRIAAIVIKFFMVKILRGFYTPVPTSA